jgi:RNA polymerase sigma-70 factor, ECF subfamily
MLVVTSYLMVAAWSLVLIVLANRWQAFALAGRRDPRSAAPWSDLTSLSSSDDDDPPGGPPSPSRPALTEDQRAALALLTSRSMRPRVRLWIAWLGIQPWDIEDVIQEVFAAVADAIHRYDRTRASPERWMNRIVVHVCAKYHERAQHRREELAPEPIEQEDTTPTAVELLERESDRMDALELLQTALLSVPARERLVVLAHDIGGASMKEIAAEWGESVSTLYKWRARGLAALAKALRSMRG